MKKERKDSSDAYLALLDCRLDCSPAQHLMSRQTKILLPTIKTLLAPEVSVGQHQKIIANKSQQAKYHNKGARDLPELKSGDVVRANLSTESFSQGLLKKAQDKKKKVGERRLHS